MSTIYQTRTRTDRYGGYSNFSPERDEDEEREEYTSHSMFDDEEETPEFEVQKNYTMMGDRDVVREEERITMNMPNVIRKTQVNQTVSDKKLKIRARGKIAIAVYSIILLTLIAFSIYNAVAINQMQASVYLKNQEYITQSVVINDLLDEYNKLGSDERILDEVAGEFIEPTNNHIVRVSKGSMEERQETQIESNWFEDLCSFLSNLFS